MSKSLLSGINDRVEADKQDGDIAYLYALLIKLEFLSKIITAGVVACLDEDENRHRYTLEHELIRADSFGSWNEPLSEALVGSSAHCIAMGAREITKDLTELVSGNDWRYQALKHLSEASAILGARVDLGYKAALRGFLDIATRMRNRGRGHGAPRVEQGGHATPFLELALEAIESKTKVLQLPWVYLYRNRSGKYRVTPLLNDPGSFEYLKRTADVARFTNGVYLNLDPDNPADPRPVELVFTDADLLDVLLPNGNYRGDKFEVLSYASNNTRQEDASRWSTPPNKLPRSETEGDDSLDVIGNVLTNIPPVSRSYVPRPQLERSLAKELGSTDLHPILTLTGQGGVGKTTLALKTIADIVHSDLVPYDVVLWVSARDIDLLDSGPKPVSQRVSTKKEVAEAVVELVAGSRRGDANKKDPETSFEEWLREGVGGPTLFVLDNFETLKNPRDAFDWLDTHVRLPNKVLITTRFRDFKADFPIEVAGMKDDEAAELINDHASRLGIGDLISQEYQDTLITESGGHPYVIKILLGQVATERKPVTPRRVIADADRLLEALFKRTYAALTRPAQRVFLLLSSWRVSVPQVAVEAVLLRPSVERFDVEDALEEVIRYSLVERTESDADGSAFVGAPLAAAIFGGRELDVSPIKPSVEEDRKLLMDFGPGKKRDAHSGVLPRIENLIKAVAVRATAEPSHLDEDLTVLEYLAQRYPRTYLSLAELILEVSDGSDSTSRAKDYVRSFLREAEMSQKRSAWLRLADLCNRDDDGEGEIQAVCEAAVLPTANLQELSDDVNRLNNRIRRMKGNVDDPRFSDVRNSLKKVSEAMNGRLKDLSPTDCSRLAWLHWNLGNRERALDVANVGVQKDSSNEHCARLIERLNRA